MNSPNTGCSKCTNGKNLLKSTLNGKNHYTCSGTTQIKNCFWTEISGLTIQCDLCEPNYQLSGNLQSCTLIPENQRLPNCNYYWQGCYFCKPGFTFIQGADPLCQPTPAGYEGCWEMQGEKCLYCQHMDGYYANGYSLTKGTSCQRIIPPKIKKHDGSTSTSILSVWVSLVAALITQALL